MSIIALVPARGGSKSIPLKNIKPFCGRPLIYWTLAALSECAEIDEIVVATDSHTIKDTVKRLSVPRVTVYDRDPANATDSASTESVMLEFIENRKIPMTTALLLAQCTSPLTTADDYKRAINLFSREDVDSVLSGVRQKRFFWTCDGVPLNYDYRNRPLRQDFEGVFWENGAFYISPVARIVEHRNRLSGRIRICEMSEHAGVDLDEPEDWIQAEQLMQRDMLKRPTAATPHLSHHPAGREQDNTVLRPRFAFDGRPVLTLNRLQVATRAQVCDKMSRGVYKLESVPCCICTNTNTFQRLAGKDRYGLPMDVVICEQCGLIQTRPRMTNESYEDFYKEHYRQLYLSNSNTAGPSEDKFQERDGIGRSILDALTSLKLMDNPADLCVMEVGCADGGILNPFKELGCKVQGMDLNAEYCEYGRTRHGLNLSVDTIFSVKLEQQPDIIIYNHVLEHILSPNEEIEKIRELLPDSGSLFINVPSVKMIHMGYRGDFLLYLQNAHVYHFTLRTLVNLMSKHHMQMLGGNEMAAAVFKKSEEHRPTTIVNDYNDALTYLNNLERLRFHTEREQKTTAAA